MGGFVERRRGVRLRRVNVSAVMTKVVHSSHVRPRWPPHSLGSVTVVGQVTVGACACRLPLTSVLLLTGGSGVRVPLSHPVRTDETTL